jgi:hypothetical protein
LFIEFNFLKYINEFVINKRIKEKQKPVITNIQFMKDSSLTPSKQKYIKIARNNSIERINNITIVLLTDWNSSFQYWIKYCMKAINKINKRKIALIELLWSVKE